MIVELRRDILNIEVIKENIVIIWVEKDLIYVIGNLIIMVFKMFIVVCNIKFIKYILYILVRCVYRCIVIYFIIYIYLNMC